MSTGRLRAIELWYGGVHPQQPRVALGFARAVADRER